MYYRIFNLPIARWLFQGAKAIPIAGTKEDPALMQRAFERADAELADGQVLGIFPEGALTRDGDIAPFRPGVERILAARPVPVLPMALCGMWASMWSRRRGLRLPRRFRAEVQLVVGPLLPPEEATAARLEAIVRGLRGDRP
jgi:1-acyl-sn-glycerol-3-phosphate acyltransferase